MNNSKLINCDKEAETLYLRFRKPQRTTETIEMTEDMSQRKDDERILELAIPSAGAQAKLSFIYIWR